MRRTGTTMLAGLVVGLFLVSYAHAEQPMHGKGMRHGGKMMGTDSAGCMHMMGKRMGMMGGMMMPRQMVAVDDGIIVVIGNKLVKYDKNLDKKNEVTLEVDDDAMKAMLLHMQKMHATCRSMMGTSDEAAK